MKKLKLIDLAKNKISKKDLGKIKGKGDCFCNCHCYTYSGDGVTCMVWLSAQSRSGVEYGFC